MNDRLEITVKNGIAYDIVYEKDFSLLKGELSRLELINKKACIVTDNIVEPLYAQSVKEVLESAGNTVFIFTFHNGEESKNLDTVQDLYETLIENHFDRSSFLVALGGGVVGDMTGFAAATYLRGIDFIQIPTTLLAMVDSSIGGKTGVDFKQYKNMVGAFKMPRLVYMNLTTLSTLEERQYYAGFAEAMKSALIKDSFYYEWLIENMYEIFERDPDTLTELVYKSCCIKKYFVEKDPYEKGDRAILNLGHTVGHAIEKYKNFTMLHGECVALGCVVAAFISWKREMLSMDEYYEIRDMFVPFNLPISIEDMDINTVLSYTKSDKKMKDGQIRFILLKKIGKAVIDNTVTDNEITDALKEILYIEDFE